MVYLDDGCLGGRGESVISRILKKVLVISDLELNPSKYEVHFVANVKLWTYWMFSYRALTWYQTVNWFSSELFWLSLSLTKFTYSLRCCPLCKFTDDLKTLDTQIRDVLEDILNIRLDENGIQQCFLPIDNGGLGNRLASDFASDLCCLYWGCLIIMYYSNIPILYSHQPTSQFKFVSLWYCCFEQKFILVCWTQNTSSDSFYHV